MLTYAAIFLAWLGVGFLVAVAFGRVVAMGSEE